MATKIILTAHQRFMDLALNELRRIYPDSKPVRSIHPGIVLVAFDGSPRALGKHWLYKRPVYVHHFHPVDVEVPLQNNPGDISRIQQVMDRHLLTCIQPQLSLDVQIRFCSPRPLPAEEVDPYLRDSIRDHLSLAGTNHLPPEQVLSVTVVREKAWLGVSLAALNVSPWPGGRKPFPYDPGQLTRSELKLLEAIEEFKINLRPASKALDLGSSLGGWTRILRRHGLQVTAVDSAQLSPSLQFDPYIRHMQMPAQVYLKKCKGHFDLIVNDMGMDAQDSARIMVAYSQHLQAKGCAIMTVKLRERSLRRVMDHTFRILRKSYRIVRVRQLAHNRSEVTVYLKKR